MSDDVGAVRTRTVTWRDTREGVSAAKTMSGLEYLRAIARGALPPAPIAVVLGFTVKDVAEGKVVFEVAPGEHQYNPIGTVHGGLAATVLDSAMGCAVHTLLPVGTAYTTLELHVNYVRPILWDSGPLTCTGEVLHQGGRVATAQGRLTDASGKLYAHGTTTCMLLRPPSAGGRE
ncbi:PaaI family thioesterase [Myxococcaceae bacterium JPH2]|nr:PaaI family thioesterase [Myxococcaceae bacterium JPH2]